MKLLKRVLTILKSRIHGNRPFILSHLITSRCNCFCKMCVYRDSEGNLDTDLGIEEIKRIYSEANKIGFTDIVLWGGEPLIRNDIIEICDYAKKIGFSTTLITNGLLLEKKSDVAKLVDRVLISIDSPDDLHDEIRGVKGLFKRVIDAINKIQNQTKVIIISVICSSNKNKIAPLIEFAKRYNLDIIFQSLNSADYGFFNTNETVNSLTLSREEEKETFKYILHEKKKYKKILNSDTYLNMFISGNTNYKCYYKHTLLRVEPDGKILDCTKKKSILYDLKKGNILDLLNSREYKDFLLNSHMCSTCMDAGVIETSKVWFLNLDCFVNIIRQGF